MRRFDADNDGKLRFSDFAEALSPKQSDYLELLTRREAVNSDLQYRLRELFATETLLQLKAVFTLHLENEVTIEMLRKRLSNNLKFNYHDAFEVLDINEDSFIS